MGERISFVARSEAMRRALRRIDAVAETRDPVVLVGEPGSGRARAAKRIHASGDTGGGIAEVVGDDLPPHWLDARRVVDTAMDRETRTLILSHLDDVTDHVAESIISVVRRRVRPIVITTRPLSRAWESWGKQTIYIPPLRERLSDIPELAVELLGDVADELVLDDEFVLDSEALDALVAYAWKGNVAELDGVLRHAGIAARRKGTITAADLPARVRSAQRVVEAAEIEPLVVVERRTILEALRRCRGRRAEAARALGISRRTMTRKVRRYGIGAVDIERR